LDGSIFYCTQLIGFDGSEIPMPTTVWMFVKPLVNHGSATTNLNWSVRRRISNEPSTSISFVFLRTFSFTAFLKDASSITPNFRLGTLHMSLGRFGLTA